VVGDGKLLVVEVTEIFDASTELVGFGLGKETLQTIILRTG